MQKLYQILGCTLLLCLINLDLTAQAEDYLDDGKDKYHYYNRQVLKTDLVSIYRGFLPLYYEYYFAEVHMLEAGVAIGLDHYNESWFYNLSPNEGSIPNSLGKPDNKFYAQIRYKNLWGSFDEVLGSSFYIRYTAFDYSEFKVNEFTYNGSFVFQKFIAKSYFVEANVGVALSFITSNQYGYNSSSFSWVPELGLMLGYRIK